METAVTLNATFIPQALGVRCVTPPLPAGDYTVEVTLNGQQYTNGTVDANREARRCVTHIVHWVPDSL